MSFYTRFHKNRLLLCCLAFCSMGYTLKAQSCTLNVTLTSVHSGKGKVMLALFRQAEGFPSSHEKAFKLMQAPARQGDLRVSFPALPAGTYALAVYHDENADGKLNTNMLGIPKEGYAFSNNVRPKFSAPDFQDAAFSVDASTVITLQVRY
jgi:uncharacterized protein (DUF2141 family)